MRALALAAIIVLAAMFAPATALAESPPALSIAFGASPIALSSSTTLTFTITNPNADELTGAGFDDALPQGLDVVLGSTDPEVINVCGGTVSSEYTSISASGLAIDAGGQCQFSVTVEGAAPGTVTDTTGQVTSDQAPPGAAASATANVDAPPTIAAGFESGFAVPGGATSLVITITNPGDNPDPASDVSVTDAMPTGLSLTTVYGQPSSTCGGNFTSASNQLSLSGASLPVGGQCQIAAGVEVEDGEITDTTGNVSSTEGAVGGTASATVIGAYPPNVEQSVSDDDIPLDGTTTLTFYISSLNTSATLTGMGFTDTLPPGLVVAYTGAVTGTCDGGTTVAEMGSNTFSMSDAFLPPDQSCMLSVVVQGVVPGEWFNSTVIDTVTGVGGMPNRVGIAVDGPPALSEQFSPATIAPGGTSQLTFQVDNTSDPDTLHGVSFTDTLPHGLVVSTPNALTGSCPDGTVGAEPGGSSITLSGASLAAATSCTFAVDVTAPQAGEYENTTSGATSTESGSAAGAGSTGMLTVGSEPTDSEPTTAQPPSTAPLSLVPSSPSAVPNNTFQVDELSARSDGSISFTVSIPGPGTIAVLETAPDRGKAEDVPATRRPGPGRFTFGRAHFAFSGATTRRLSVRPNSPGRRALQTRHALQVIVWVTYTPIGGKPRTISFRWGKFSGSFFG